MTTNISDLLAVVEIDNSLAQEDLSSISGEDSGLFKDDAVWSAADETVPWSGGELEPVAYDATEAPAPAADEAQPVSAGGEGSILENPGFLSNDFMLIEVDGAREIAIDDLEAPPPPPEGEAPVIDDSFVMYPYDPVYWGDEGEPVIEITDFVSDDFMWIETGDPVELPYPEGVRAGPCLGPAVRANDWLYIDPPSDPVLIEIIGTDEPAGEGDGGETVLENPDFVSDDFIWTEIGEVIEPPADGGGEDEGVLDVPGVAEEYPPDFWFDGEIPLFTGGEDDSGELAWICAMPACDVIV